MNYFSFTYKNFQWNINKKASNDNLQWKYTFKKSKKQQK